MKNTLNAEIYKIFQKKGLYFTYAIVVMWSMLITIVFYYSNKELGLPYNASIWAIPNAELLATYIMMLLIAFAYLIVSTDYVEGTAANLILIGTNRVNLYIAKLITFLLNAILMVTVSFIAVTVTTGLFAGWGTWDKEIFIALLKVYGKFIIYIIPYTAHFSLLCLLINNHAGALISCFFLTTVFSMIVRFIEIDGLQEIVPFLPGNIVGAYDKKYLSTWIVLCIVSYFVTAVAGILLSKNKNLK